MPLPGHNQSMFNNNRLKLGIFSANCSSGITAVTVPERWEATWDNNVAIAQKADAAGIECMVPVARWRGYGGETDFQKDTFETLTWATGLLGATRHMTVFGTVHVPLIHPIFAAKQLVTADHVGKGRMGLNIVAGWNFSEFDMFGEAPLEHDERYAYAQEWWDIVKGIWREEGPFGFKGDHFDLKDIVGDPKPYQGERLVTMNAGASPVGREFGAGNFDFLFTPLRDPATATEEVAEAKALAAAAGNTLHVFALSLIVCKPTQKEAEDYYDYACRQNRDEAAVEKLLAIRGLEADKLDPNFLEMMRDRLVGHGLYPIVGDPDHVAGELAKLTDMGFDGTSISWVNYLEEFDIFADEVLPRLERMGLREPFSSAL